MGQSLSAEQFDNLETALMNAVNSTLAVRGCSDAARWKLRVSPQGESMRNVLLDLKNDSQSISRDLTHFISKYDMSFYIPDNVKQVIGQWYGGSMFTFSEIEGGWKKIASSKYMDECLDSLIAQNEMTFQYVVQVASIALNANQDALVSTLFSDNGTLRKAAFWKGFLGIRALAIKDYKPPFGVDRFVLKPAQIASSAGSASLADSSRLLSPNVKYVAPEFTFITVEQQGGLFSEGMKTTVAGIEGTLIKPDSEEFKQLVEDAVGSWLLALKKDNNVRA